MSKIRKSIIGILSLYTTIFIILLFSIINKYTLVPFKRFIIPTILVIIIIILLKKMLKYDKKEVLKTDRILLVISSIIVPLDWILSLFVSHNNLFIVSFIITYFCLVFIIFKMKQKKITVPEVIIIAIQVLFLQFLFLFTFLGILFNGYSNRRVVSKIDSPKKNYTAILIDSDQGALGGSTFVDISYNKRYLNLFLFKIEKEQNTIYTGKWQEYKGMSIKWKNENTLLIDDNEYKVK